MARSLLRIVNDTGSSKDDQQSDYFKEVGLFDVADKYFLREFLRLEMNAKSHYLENEGWELLVGDLKEYSRPIEYMQEQRDKFPELEKSVKDMFVDGTLSKMELDPKTIKLFGDLPTAIWWIIEMKTRMYELVVTCAKQIASKEGINPIDVIQSKAGRNEIYRRTFVNEEKFKEYNNIQTELRGGMLDVAYDMVESIEQKSKNIPFVSWLLEGEEINKVLGRIPPKDVAGLFFENDGVYWATRAEEIYGNKIAGKIGGGEILEMSYNYKGVGINYRNNKGELMDVIA